MGRHPLCQGRGAGEPHHHPHEHFACAISGKCGYLKHEWIASPGGFAHESPGAIHTLVACEHEDPMRAFFIVTGPPPWLDDKGEAAGHFDASDDMKMCRDHCESVGLGTEFIDGLVR